MIYDLSNPLDAERFSARVRFLSEKQRMVELTEKKSKRTINQNSYLWLLLSYWALELGYTKAEAEAIYKHINKDIFYKEKEIAGNKINYIRHINELDMSEMSLSIDRWRNFSSAETGVYLPSSEEFQSLQIMEKEVERAMLYL